MKNIDTEQAFNQIRTAGNYNYTIDDFMSEYRVSKRLADTLLKDIDHISISQSLYTRLDEVDRKKFYNRVEVFRGLLDSGKLRFYVRYYEAMWLGTRDKNTDSVASEQVPPVYIFNRLDLFFHILNSAGTPREVTFLKYSNKEKVNRHYNRIQGVELKIGTQIRRLYKLDINDTHYEPIKKMIMIPVSLIALNEKVNCKPTEK